MSKKKKTVKIQMFRPRDKEVIKRTSPTVINDMARETIENCESWKKQTKEKWEKGEISDKQYKDEIKRQDKMISDARKTIAEVKNEIINFIKAHNIKPSDVYSREDLLKCPGVKKYLEAKKTEIKKSVTNAYYKRKRLEEKFDKWRDEKRKRLEELKRMIKEENDLLSELNNQKKGG